MDHGNSFNTNVSEYTGLISHMSYAGIFIWFLVLEQFTPIPEEVMLLGIGYAAGHGLMNIYWGALSAFMGLIIFDTTLFILAFSGNKLINRFKNKMSKNVFEKYEKKISEHPVKTLLIMSFLPKLRFFSPIVAGAFHIHWKKFILVNTLCTFTYVALYIGAGMFFHQGLEALFRKVESVRHLIFIGILIGVGIFLVIWMKKKLSK